MGEEDKACKTIKDTKTMMREARRSLNVNEEYQGALRTKSYGDFFMKAHDLLVSGVFVTTTCGLVAVAAVVLAAHTLAALIMGPAILTIIPLKRSKINKFTNRLRFLKCGFLSKIGAQLDVAAKGTYILNRDFDTMSRLVDRLHDEIEHNKAMIRLCLDRREDSISLKVLKELKKSNVGFRKQVEELEEHVYLCLLTINRARNLVINEIGKSCE
ncbi:hypothetical protein KY284_010058 [Solanum tuberosum]|nr:hypothetical protein KY284_010058 [Solanum tuberosum]